MTYHAIKSAIEAEGFFVSQDTEFGRLLCASLRRPDGGLTGNSFWVAERSSGWFLGTWGTHLYRIPDPSRVPELCISWLRRQPHRTAADVDEGLLQEFHLVGFNDFPGE